MDEQPTLSQASSHLPLEPVSGIVLFRQETARREGLRARGNCRTGCRELDEHVLLGGFERGCVVGVSAEEEEIGLSIGLQTLSRLLVEGGHPGRLPEPKAMIITTLSNAALLPKLRAVIKAQVSAVHGDVSDRQIRARQCLERISVSRVFDVDGLWEVLGELDESTAAGSTTTGPRGARNNAEPPPEPPSIQQPSPSLKQKTEIMDSEEEDGMSPLESSSGDSTKNSAPGKAEEQASGRNLEENKPIAQKVAPPSVVAPDIILITHMSQLLTAFFAQRDRQTAHTMLQLLTSHLRYVTRCPEHGGPLVMILNSTTSSPDATSVNTTADHLLHPADPDAPPPRPPEPGTAATRPSRPLDRTLRSIFSPQPASANYRNYGAVEARRNKPSFGLVFTQLLDLHLLCTRVPRTRADAEVLFAPPPHSQIAAGGTDVRGLVDYAWVVEVLLDEIGVWEEPGPGAEGGGEGRGQRRSREQRWGAVDVRRNGEGGLIIVDAFEAKKVFVGEIRVAGGFGGRRG
ncbi:Fasciclin domain family [Pleurostoma richardsiae]|uniref:Fasciclin domain family n=1 Tax=Pleurostoma richardsiae TaxID=41990 RepID=A0AA38VJ72_9PEZI|nr:Fasciclin domain family [Pleurostoma richardsiae]